MATILAGIVKSIIRVMAKPYYKKFGYAGIAFIALLLEAGMMWLYHDNALENMDLQNDVVFLGSTLLGKQGDGKYLYELEFENLGNEMNRVFGIGVTDIKGSYHSAELQTVYQGIDRWGGTPTFLIVPPGECVKVKALLEADAEADIENISFFPY